MDSNSNQVIFHADMDAFYASIEQRDNPSYRGKPLVVGAQPGSRGVVSAASYEARRFGIRSAMPISEAYRRCPEGIYVRPRMSAYVQESHKVMAILHSFTPLVEPLSIDEAFLDMTGTERLWGAARKAAEALSGRIRDELHLSVSVGIAPNKFLAKLASDMNKPDGITETPFEPSEIPPWLAPLPVSCIWGVGAKSQEILAAIGVETIGDLQHLSIEQLRRRFGENGRRLFDLARGLDEREVSARDEVKSLSREHTFSVDSSDRQLWREVLLSLSRDVSSSARRKSLKGRTIVLTYRTPDFRRHSRRVSLDSPTNLVRIIYTEAIRILEKIECGVHSLRLIGVGLTNLGDTEQLDLFANPKKSHAWEASEAAMDNIAERFGDDSIFLGGEAGEGRKGYGKRTN